MSRLRAEDGFSLVELLVTMVILSAVLGGVLTAVDAFQRQAAADNSRGDQQDAARRAVDEMVTRLRGVVSSGSAANVDRAETNDLVIRNVDPANPPVSGGANAARLMYVRFCVKPTTQKLWEQTFHWTSATVPDPPDNALASPRPCPGTGWDSPVLLADHVTTSGGNVFTFLPNASAVSQVNLLVGVDLDPSKPPAETRLRSGVTLRNLPQPPSPVINCAAVGSGQVVCDSFGTADPDGGALSYAWSYQSGACPTPPGTGWTPLATTQPQINQAGLTAGPYCFKLDVTDPTNMTGSVTQAVTAR